MSIERTELLKLWNTNPFQCFPLETIECLASHPEIQNAEELELVLQKIVRNRMRL